MLESLENKNLQQVHAILYIETFQKSQNCKVPMKSQWKVAWILLQSSDEGADDFPIACAKLIY